MFPLPPNVIRHHQHCGRQEPTSHRGTSRDCEASFGPNIHETSFPNYCNVPSPIRCQQQTNRARNRLVRMINGSRARHQVNGSATPPSAVRRSEAFVPSIHCGGRDLTKYL
ncbi:hypothetical protein MCOR34_002690 [Pyricularia oryzae]|nr:hypothetical protein MCOR34_002690 [Pyricularia oryzae]KAI6461533.1 hypothetical protein MCOR17_006329 [Pyricularia oryzae]